MEMVGQPYRRRASHGHLIDYCSGEDEQKRGGSEHGNSFASRAVLYITMYASVCVCSTIPRVPMEYEELDQLLRQILLGLFVVMLLW
jgi:hypothetical protein